MLVFGRMKKKKTLHILEYELPIVIQEEKENGYIARCPIWDDCYAQGETIEEAINELSYVATSLIELYKEENLKVPLKLKKSTQQSEATLTLKFPLIVSTQ